MSVERTTMMNSKKENRGHDAAGEQKYIYIHVYTYIIMITIFMFIIIIILNHYGDQHDDTSRMVP